MTIYTYPNMQGQARTYSAPAPFISQQPGWGARSGSVVIHFGQWRICQQPNYGGRCVTLGPGRYGDIANLGFHGPVGSLSPLPGYAPGAPIAPPPPPRPQPPWNGGYGALTLYEDENFGGQAFAVSREIHDLSRHGFNDRASSMIVTAGRWQVCDQGNFGPPCRIFGPGRYPALRFY